MLKYLMIPILFGWGCFWAPSEGLSKEVVATGQAAILNSNVGSARNQALQNAQRQAVEQGVGALVDSKTLSENFEIIQDQIYSSSRGYVKSFEILEEGRVDGGESYSVTIRAVVAEDALQNQLGALRILHKKMGNKRVMVIYRKKDPNALPKTNGAVRNATIAIRDELNSKGFRLFNESVTNKIYQTIETAAAVDRPEETLMALALDHRAEVLIEFELVAGKRGRSGGQFHATKVTMKLGAYDTSTGRQIADVISHGKELSTQAPGAYDLHEMLGKASKRAGSNAVKKVIPQIADYYQNVGDQGFAYLIVFRNFSADQEDEILDYLESTAGFKSLSELGNSPNYLEIELFSSESKSRLRRQIRRELKQKNIYFTAQETSGNRLVLVRSTDQ